MGDNLTVEGNTVLGNETTDTLTVNSLGAFSNDMSFYNNVNIVSNAMVPNQFTVDAISEFNETVIFNSNVTISSINGGLFTAENI